ncbi:MAG TPA: glycosyltransferase family 1 protein [Thermodesulfobacteriota bacterium]|nr:glycosyltransferase family 1 protein [Thermodesulfobacteriota bacterium]
MSKKIRLIVNAIPATYVNTGIARYLRCLYAEMEKLYGDRLDIGYFDGKTVSRILPLGPANPGQWSRMTELFWRLPAPAALLIRLAFHAIQEFRFYRLSQNFHLYHEAAYFPFKTTSHLKRVLTIHDLSLIRFPQYHPRERVLYTKLFLKNRCKRVDHFLAVSDFTNKEMQTHLGTTPDKSTVTPLAYDHAIFYPRSPSRVEEHLSANHLPSRYFLFVGSGDPRKNMDSIPAALAHAGVDIPLVVVGWAGWAKNTRSATIHFVGYVTDEELAHIYSGALALVFPSTYEGFGLPILEAMACGCPVITTTQASLPEVAGNAAVYVDDPGDKENFGNTLKKVAEDDLLRKEMRQKGLCRAQEFSWQRTAEITMSVFEKILAE